MAVSDSYRSSSKTKFTAWKHYIKILIAESFEFIHPTKINDTNLARFPKMSTSTIVIKNKTNHAMYHIYTKKVVWLWSQSCVVVCYLFYSLHEKKLLGRTGVNYGYLKTTVEVPLKESASNSNLIKVSRKEKNE